MAPDIPWLPRSLGIQFKDPDYKKARSRPLPLRVRTYSIVGIRSPGFDENRDGLYPRNKSLSGAAILEDLSPVTAERIMEESGEENGELSEVESVRSSLDSAAGRSSIAGSPVTSLTGLSSERNSLDDDALGITVYDFAKVDYELEKAKVLGQGLWSVVYLAEPKSVRTHRRTSSSLSSSKSPRSIRKQRGASATSLFAVKTPARRDAKEIFLQEARVLSHLQRRSTAAQHVVPFVGLDPRNDSLVFEAVIGGSLESLTGRLKQMTEVARHLELISIFPGIAYDLISGLDFLHANAVVHADIKPGNILLDVTEHATQQRPVVRARYIDFSAAFLPSRSGDAAAHAGGGTWDYMAPEQMRVQRELHTPTRMSDVWSLGITLLFVLVGESPYAAACGGGTGSVNVFMLREAIKTGDPLQFARMEPVARKRLAAAQDFVDCCRQALKKDRENRTTAAAWLSWVEQSGT